MTTLAEYAHQHFPQHPMDGPDARTPLASHTVVAHVVGLLRGSRLETAMRREVGADRVSSVVIEPTEPTVVNEGGEDPEGIFDLPHRRVIAGAAAGALALGAVAGVVGGLIIGSLAAGLVLAAFAAAIGGVVGGMIAGGGRYAGNRAWEQRHVPDRALMIVAVLIDDEHEANRVATLMDLHEPEDVRILNREGAWHSPVS